MSQLRRELLLRGVVQGVGFRPHVAAVAARHGVSGFCGNDDRAVFIEVQGTAAQVDGFIAAVFDDAPPLARILAHNVRDLPVVDHVPGRAGPGGDGVFAILESRRAPGARTLLPPDVATCPDCLAELRDPANRRFGYPFITCVNCGPRLSIIEDVPYDRPATTMREFPMCPACTAEYTDPANRRHHAQPISCFDCGPRLWLEEGGPATGTATGTAPDRSPAAMQAVIDRARELLDAGAILAVKGIGGFHLMCDAANESAVAELRRRKHRPDKPFAVMVPDLAAARALADLGDSGDVALLSSPARPIVIVPKATGRSSGRLLAPSVAPGLADIGIMLPYSPLHELLVDKPLVATSGNPPGEALCHDNAQARARLGDIADAFLLHDRGIHVPVEDSVFLGRHPVRRSRGFAPLPLPLPLAVPLPGRRDSLFDDPTSPASPSSPAVRTFPPILAVGGELKNTFTIVDDGLAHVSPHIGDMRSAVTQRCFGDSVKRALSMRNVEPRVVVHDLHPDYATTAWAERFVDDLLAVGDVGDVRLVAVQHHYAHALSLLAEHGIGAGPAVIATLDGTGFGVDGTIWGGEILTLGAGDGGDRGDLRDWARTWHVPSFDIAGGDRSVQRPWRTLVSIATSWNLDLSLDEIVGGECGGECAGRSAIRHRDSVVNEREVLASQLSAGVGVIGSTSMGRIFDAAAVLVGCGAGRWRTGAISYEAQAAMEFERLAGSAPTMATGFPRRPRSPFGPTPATIPELFVELAGANRSAAERALRFHVGLARIIAAEMINAADAAGTTTLGVTGGCSLNRILVSALDHELSGHGLTLLQHSVVPANDGGLSLGQAMAGLLSFR